MPSMQGRLANLFLVSSSCIPGVVWNIIALIHGVANGVPRVGACLSINRLTNLISFAGSWGLSLKFRAISKTSIIRVLKLKIPQWLHSGLLTVGWAVFLQVFPRSLAFTPRYMFMVRTVHLLGLKPIGVQPLLQA